MKKLFNIGISLLFVFVLGCDLNPLGGSKSKLDPLFEPGKHTPSAPPVLSAISDFIMDENDVQTIPFTINDPDTFMVCSLVFVKAYSANDTLIDSSGMVVGGTYPNCTLTLSPKPLQYGVVNITVDLYDFWTHAKQDFKLTVAHILSPGAFLITDAEGGDQTVDLTWQNAAYMIGNLGYTSGYYTIYFREHGTSAYTSIPRVNSPYLVTGLTNGTEYDFYVRAQNSIGSRNSQVVQAQPTRFKFRGAEFISASTQYENTPGMATTVKTVNSTLVAYSNTAPALVFSAPENPVGTFPVGAPAPSAITTPSGNYKVYMNSQGNILSGVGQ